jgi:hypothetical protein
MIRYYWYCQECKQRGNKLYDKKKDAEKRIEIHKENKKCNKTKIHSTKSQYLPIHINEN